MNSPMIQFFPIPTDRPTPDGKTIVETPGMKSSELLLAMASVANSGLLDHSHWFARLTPYLAATWPLDGGWPEPDMTETRVLRILFAREMALEAGD